MTAMRIVFCGETFPSARVLLQERLQADECHVWPDGNTLCRTNGVDVLIPMMFRIDAPVMDHIRPRLVQQWGSGLEGGRLAAARARRIPLAGVPSSGRTSASVPAHPRLLMLA